MKIALVISSLRPGGAERVMSVLANAWAGRGTTVSLITLSRAATDFYRLDSRISRIGLDALAQSSNVWSGAARNVRRLFALHTALKSEKPDVVLSFMTPTNVLSVLACRVLGVPCIVSERTLPRTADVGGLWGLGYTFTYRRASAIVAQTHRAAEWLEQRFRGVPVRVISNPVIVEDPHVGAEEAERILRPLGGRPFLMAMGRLSPEKGFDLLLRAFAKVSSRHPHWWLIVIGEGRARSSLEELVRKLGLEEKVLFPGITQHPHALLRRAGAFVLSSRFEGLPMGLLEAMACSLPCISYDCPNGPRELITHEVSGLLVPSEDVSSLAQHILKVLDAPSFARQLGVQAAKVAESYSLDSVLPCWDATIAELV